MRPSKFPETGLAWAESGKEALKTPLWVSVSSSSIVSSSPLAVTTRMRPCPAYWKCRDRGLQGGGRSFSRRGRSRPSSKYSASVIWRVAAEKRAADASSEVLDPSGRVASSYRAVKVSVPMTLSTASAAVFFPEPSSRAASGSSSTGRMIFPRPPLGSDPSSGTMFALSGPPRRRGICPTKRPSCRAGLRTSASDSSAAAKERERTHSTWIVGPWLVTTSTRTVLRESLA